LLTFFYFGVCSFEEVAETAILKGSALQIVLTSGTRYVFYTHRAIQIRNMIERYIVEMDKVKSF